MLQELRLIYFCAACLLSSGIIVKVQVSYLQETDTMSQQIAFLLLLHSTAIP